MPKPNLLNKYQITTSYIASIQKDLNLKATPLIQKPSKRTESRFTFAQENTDETATGALTSAPDHQGRKRSGTIVSENDLYKRIDH